MNNTSFNNNKLNTRKYLHAQRRFDIEKENIDHFHQEKKQYLKDTKNLLTISFMSILFCLFALTGTTYAWFTSTVSNSNNRIQAGTLDVGLLAENSNGQIIDLSNNAATIFDAENLTPGNPIQTMLTVQNNGTADLKFATFFDITKDFNPNTESDDTKLSKKLNVYVRDYVDNDANPPTVSDYKGTMADFAGTSGFISGRISSEEKSKKYRVWIELDSSAELETYKNQQIKFDINLYATQDTSEIDGFGSNQYDIDTPWMGDINEVISTEEGAYEIKNGAELAWIAKQVNEGSIVNKTIKLVKNIDLNNVEWIQIDGAGKNITFDGQNHTIINLKISKGHDAGFFSTGSGCTVKNVTFDGANVKGVGRIATVVGHGMCTTVTNCTVKNSTVTAVVTNNDDGDKAGAIVGYLSGEPNAIVSNCTVENVTVQGYRDIGGVVGIAQGTYTVTNNTIKNSTIINDRTNNYKDYTLDAQFDANTIIGEQGANGTVSGNGATNVTISKIAPVVVPEGKTVQEAVTGAITTANAGDIIILPNTENGIKLPKVPSGVTLKGDGTTKINATGGGGIADINGAVLDGFIIEYKSGEEYTGFQHSDALIRNCTIKGFSMSYNAGGEQVFENCTFVQDIAGYNMWAYGNVSYKNCTFKSYGKFINVYNEGTSHFDVNFENCKFINLDSSANKAAINVKDTSGSNQLNITVTIKDCVYEGVAPESLDTSTLKVYNPIVQLDDIGSGPSNIIIKKDGVTLWPNN